VKTHYDVLEIARTASAEEIRSAFRQLIARYHPDKVQHLGQEFQEMAATRAADLTAAYHVLSNPERRTAYDAALGDASLTPPVPPETHAPPVAPPNDESPAQSVDDTVDAPPTAGRPQRFTRERQWRDELVRKASLQRFRNAVARGLGSYTESPAGAFDVAAAPKTKLFARTKGPRLVGRFVPKVDGASVAEAWARVAKLNLPASDEVCVMLMGTEVAPATELADAIAEQRRRHRQARITIIPIDANSWDAHVPTDAPPAARTLLTSLRSGD
jgi:curved DNA-binding protein CbpA